MIPYEKNVKNSILTYNSTHFKGIDKKLLNNCLLRMIANILFVIRQCRHFILYSFKIIKF